MPLVIDDIAAAAAIEAATAEVGSTVGVEAMTSTELAAVPESTAVADDVLAENASSLDMSDNVFVDEYPSQETSEVGVEPDKNVFYDEYPADVNTEADSAKDVSAETTPEIETPKPYNEFCETRTCGGSYKELNKEGWGWNDKPAHDVHHMPAASVSNLEKKDGPAIAMDYSDHQKTASNGRTREAIEYRAAQKELIKKGDFRGALQMDIDDIIPSGNGGINREGRTLKQICKQPVTENLYKELESSNLPPDVISKVRSDLNRMGSNRVPAPAHNGHVDFHRIAWPGIRPTLPNMEELISAIKKNHPNISTTSITGAHIREETYYIAHKAVADKYGISISEAANLIGKLDFCPHETENGKIELVPNNVHRFKNYYAHKGYVSKMLKEINGKDFIEKD